MVLILLFGFTSCVGARKYKELNAAKVKLESELKKEIDGLKEEKVALETSEKHLRDELIGQNTLLSSLLADKLDLEKEISELKSTIDQVNDESESTQAQLNKELQVKNSILQRKEEVLNQLIEHFEQQRQTLSAISTKLSEQLSDFSAEEIEWFIVDHQLNIVLYSHFLFEQRGNLKSKARAALDQISQLVQEYPSLNIVVEGHTDNSSAREGSAIETTVANATTVVRYLLDPGGINTNQIQVAGKGGYAPRVSNQTPAGRQMNNRIEIQLQGKLQEFFSIIRNQIE